MRSQPNCLTLVLTQLVLLNFDQKGFVKAPSYVNATFLCRVAKIVHTPFKETFPCLVDFCQSAIICQSDISLSHCQVIIFPELVEPLGSQLKDIDFK